MNSEINAVELSDLELDNVAGGFAFSIGNGQNLKPIYILVLPLLKKDRSVKPNQL